MDFLNKTEYNILKWNCITSCNLLIETEGVIFVATKSILKNITIKKKATSRSLIVALEHADKKSCKDVVLSRGLRTADRAMIQSLFGNKNTEDNGQ